MIRKIVLSLLMGLIVQISGTTAQERKLVFSPHWLPQAQFAGYYAALDKGFYAEAGLDVEIIHPKVTVNVTELLKSGQADVISHFLVTALTARDKGVEIVNIAQLSQHSAIMFVSMRHSGIERLKDFNGKKIGIWMSGFEEIPKALVVEHKLDVEWVPILWSVNLFLMGGLDVMTVMWYNEYHQLYLSGINFDEMNVFFLREYGYDIPEDGIYTLQSTLNARPEDLKAFVQATLKGWDYVRQNKEYAIELVVEMMKQAHAPSNKAHQSWMLEKVLELIYPGKNSVLNTELDIDDFNKAASVLKERGIITGACSYKEFFQPVVNGTMERQQ